MSFYFDHSDGDSDLEDALDFEDNGSDVSMEGGSGGGGDDDDDDEDSGGGRNYHHAVAPNAPDPVQMSLEDLRNLLSEHERNRTLRKLLCFCAHGVGAARGELPYLLKVEYDRDNGNVVSKTYGTPLHFACSDQDGERQEAKVRLMLSLAKKHYLGKGGMMCSMQMIYKRDERGGRKVTKHRGRTPLQILFADCQHSCTIETIRLLCEAFPEAVHISDAESICTPLHYACCTDWFLLAGETMETITATKTEEIRKRQVSVIKTLLSAAEKTKSGAVGLVRRPTLNCAPSEGEEGEDRAATALDTLACSQKRPAEAISLLLRHWPDALKFPVDCRYNVGSYPLHDVAQCAGKRGPVVDSHESRVKGLSALLMPSTNEAIAHALLLAHEHEPTGYQMLQEAMNYEGPDSTPELKAELTALVQNIASRTDRNGRTLLHYAAAYGAEYTETEFDKAKDRVFEKIRSQNGSYDPCQLDLKEADRDCLRKDLETIEKRKEKHVQDLCRWLMDIHPGALVLRDENGMDALAFAMKNGRGWHDRLACLICYAPKWPSSRDQTGLFPFMNAAILQHDITTVFELLRYAPHVVDMR